MSLWPWPGLSAFLRSKLINWLHKTNASWIKTVEYPVMHTHTSKLINLQCFFLQISASTCPHSLFEQGEFGVFPPCSAKNALGCFYRCSPGKPWLSSPCRQTSTPWPAWSTCRTPAPDSLCSPHSHSERPASRAVSFNSLLSALGFGSGVENLDSTWK